MTAFWRQWIETQGRLHRLALRWMKGDRAAAEDVLADAAVRAVEKQHTAPPRDNLEGWMIRLLFGVCMDRHRGRRRGERLRERLQADPLGLSLLPAPPSTPEDALLSREQLDGLRLAVARLPAELRDALSLRCLHGRSYADIAAAQGITPANARKRVQLGRAALARMTPRAVTPA